MRGLIFLLFGLMSLNAFADSSCKLKTPVTFISWTGVCSDGYVDGIGELTYQFSQGQGKVAKVKTFGKVNQGIPSGLHLSIEAVSPNTGFNTYFTNGALKLIGVLVASTPENQHLPLSKRLWGGSVDLSFSHNDVITYDEALNKIKTFISQKGEPSIDFELYKAYLEGRVRVTGEDDAPVLGATLKPSGGKKKKT